MTDAPAVGSYAVGDGYVATLRPLTASEYQRGKFAPWSHVVTLLQVRPGRSPRKVAWDVARPTGWQEVADRLYVTAV